MRHASLFAGQGGFELAAHWMGWENIFSVENNPFCDKVLKMRFKNSLRYGDIKKFEATEIRGAVDVLSGGFPCQTFSLAGKGAMDLSLWKEMFRIAKELRPKWIIAENVFGLVVRKKGVALEMVCSDLEAEGFTVFSPLIIPSGSAGAPHKRDRVWIIAYSDRNGRELQSRNGGCQANQSQIKENKWQWFRIESSRNANERQSSNSDSQKLSRRALSRTTFSSWKNGKELIGGYDKPNYWEEFPSVSPIYNGNDGVSSKLGRYSRKRFSRLRKEGIKSSGNSITPQIAFEIFKAIQTIDNL